MGYKRMPTSISVDYAHPFTGVDLISMAIISQHRSVTLSTNYAFYDNQKWLRLKGIAGIEIVNNKSGYFNEQHTQIHSTDTTLRFEINQNHKYLTLVNLGLSAELLVKRKPLAEFRIMSGLGYRYNYSVTSLLDYNNYTYRNTHSTTGTYVNAILILNLNTLFGKWKD
jgi:hypothetical protein